MLICLQELEPQGAGNYFQSTTWGLDGGNQFNSYLARIPVPYQVQAIYIAGIREKD